MPWYIGDFMRDTMHLDHDQDAAYRRLIDACWMRNGQLPNDDAQLARICKMGPKLWRKVRPVVSEFFRIEADGWHHKRVDLELEKARSRLEARAKGAGKTNAKRWGATPAAEVYDSPEAENISNHGNANSAPVLNENNDVVVAERCHSDTPIARLARARSPSPSPKESSLREEGAEGSALPTVQPVRLPPATPKSIADGMVSAWKAELGDLLPVPIKITDALRRSAVLRWQDDFRSDADQWREYLRAIRGSPFLVGENDRGWRADFEWALRPRSVEKVRSGCYARARPSVPKVANGEFHLDRTEELRRAAREDIYRRTGKWQPEWGEPPSDNAARAPPSVRTH